MPGLGYGGKVELAKGAARRKIAGQQRVGHLPKKVSGRVVTGHVFSLLKRWNQRGPTPSDASELCCTVQYIHSTNAVWGNTMATTKTTTLTFRIEPGLKDAVRAAADLEHRSIANMIEMMIRDYCGRNGVPIVDVVAAAKKKKPKGN